MEKEELIRKAYDSFSIYEKPQQCTEYLDLEDAEYNTMLLSVSRRSLTIEQVGTVAWSPIQSMNSDALVYFMPRLIELAVTNVIDRDGDPFFCHFINSFFEGPENQRFKLFGAEQRLILAETFKFLCQDYYEQLEVEGWLEKTRQAYRNWGNT